LHTYVGENFHERRLVAGYRVNRCHVFEQHHVDSLQVFESSNLHFLDFDDFKDGFSHKALRQNP